MATKTTIKAAQDQKKTAAAMLRDRKIGTYREKIQQDQELISTLESNRNDQLNTDLLGATVRHFTFGSGVVVAQEPTNITVEFSFGIKKFMMPSAFTDGFLSTDDTEINDRLEQYQSIGEQIKAVKEEICLAKRSISVLESK